MPARTVVTYNDFSAGEFGSLGGWNAPKGSFTGQNVVRYTDGSLGPRNGVKAYPVSGFPVGISGVVAMGYTLFSDVYFQSTNGLRTVTQFNPLLMTPQVATNLGNGIDAAQQSINVGIYAYYITGSSGVVRVDAGTPAVTSVAGSPNGFALVKYGDRVLAAGASVAPNRLYYTAAALPESWPAANFIDVGTGTTIVALIPTRSSLAIGTIRTNTEAEFTWWILTGVPGVNAVLREVVQGTGPIDSNSSALLQDGRVAYVSPLSELPAMFDGSQSRLFRHLPVGTKDTISRWAVRRLRDESDFVVFSDLGLLVANDAFAYLRRDNTWTKQTFSEANVSAFGVLTVDSFDRNIVVLPGKGTPAAPSFYAWQYFNDKPPFSSDTFATILAPANVSFTMPEWWTRDGEEVSVRKVIVSFRDWNTGDASPNQFDVQVTPLRQYEGGEGSVKTGSFSRATSASSTGGVNLRREFNFTQDWGNGFKVGVANMRGVAIQKIQVALDTRPMQAI